MATGYRPYTSTTATITRYAEHECDAPHTEDFHGEVEIDGIWIASEFEGWFTCPACGKVETYLETHNPDNEDV